MVGKIKIKKEFISYIIRDYLNGIGITPLSKKYNVSSWTISSCLTKSNIPLRSASEQGSINLKNIRYKNSFILKIKEDYLSGLGITELSTKYHMNKNYVKTLLIKGNVKIRNAYEQIRFGIPLDSIAEKYLSGYSFFQLSRNYPLSIPSLKKIVSKFNIPHRSFSEQRDMIFPKKPKIPKPKIILICKICKKKFEPYRSPNQKYCSDKCRKKATNNRRINNRDIINFNRKKNYYKNRKIILEQQRRYYMKPKVNKRRIEYSKNYAKKNKKKISIRNKKYRNRPEIQEKNRIYFVNYLNNHRDERNTYTRKYRKVKMKTDKNFRLKRRLRCRFNHALKDFIKIGKIMSSKEYGIDYETIIRHLEPFPKDIENWHVDHIRPLCSFNFVNKDGTPNLKEIRKAFAPENHQWLLVKDNLNKGGKWNAKKSN